MVLKRTYWRHGSDSTGASACLRLTAEEAEAGLVAGLVAADVLAVRLWFE